MRILVTGATGFIGGDLARRLLSEGHEVWALVRKTSRRDGLAAMSVSLAEGDITDSESFEKALSLSAPDAVYHCAARVWDSDEKKLLRDNAQGTLNVCRACYAGGVKRLIYLSSVSVVSGNKDVPLYDGLPYKASDAYGRSKAEAEKVVVEYREKGLDTVIIRPCMVYGEEEPHALGNIISAVRARRVPILDTPGMDSRLALVYVGNVTEALIKALNKEEALSGSFMIADREVITIRKFLEIIADESGAPGPFVIPRWVVNIMAVLPPVRRKLKKYFKDRVYDISRAENMLGYNPGITTEEGLRRSVRYWMADQEASVSGRQK
jgi:nucleoside-diphosphate-sugar epimerase